MAKDSATRLLAQKKLAHIWTKWESFSVPSNFDNLCYSAISPVRIFLTNAVEANMRKGNLNRRHSYQLGEEAGTALALAARACFTLGLEWGSEGQFHRVSDEVVQTAAMEALPLLNEAAEPASKFGSDLLSGLVSAGAIDTPTCLAIAKDFAYLLLVAEADCFRLGLQCAAAQIDHNSPPPAHTADVRSAAATQHPLSPIDAPPPGELPMSYSDNLLHLYVPRAAIPVLWACVKHFEPISNEPMEKQVTATLQGKLAAETAADPSIPFDALLALTVEEGRDLDFALHLAMSDASMAKEFGSLADEYVGNAKLSSLAEHIPLMAELLRRLGVATQLAQHEERLSIIETQLGITHKPLKHG